MTFYCQERKSTTDYSSSIVMLSQRHASRSIVNRYLSVSPIIVCIQNDSNNFPEIVSSIYTNSKIIALCKGISPESRQRVSADSKKTSIINFYGSRPNVSNFDIVISDVHQCDPRYAALNNNSFLFIVDKSEDNQIDLGFLQYSLSKPGSIAIIETLPHVAFVLIAQRSAIFSNNMKNFSKVEEINVEVSQGEPRGKHNVFPSIDHMLQVAVKSSDPTYVNYFVTNVEGEKNSKIFLASSGPTGNPKVTFDFNRNIKCNTSENCTFTIERANSRRWKIGILQTLGGTFQMWCNNHDEGPKNFEAPTFFGSQVIRIYDEGLAKMIQKELSFEIMDREIVDYIEKRKLGFSDFDFSDNCVF